MVVVFDSDVLIPLILPRSRSTRLFEVLTSRGDVVAISPAILDEVREKMRLDPDVREWLGVPDTAIAQFLDRLPRICALTPGHLVLRGVVKSDPDDDKILAAALESEASVVVSEDRHLRTLREWRGIKIRSRDELLAELGRQT